MVMQVWQGRPQLLLQGRGGPLKVELNTTISNGYWHTIRIHIRSKVNSWFRSNMNSLKTTSDLNMSALYMLNI